MKVALGTFARSGLAPLGADLVEGVRTALRYYCMRRRESEFETHVLARLRHQPTAGGGEPLELSVEPEVEAELRRRAGRYEGVTVEQLAGHAVLVYLADLDLVAAGQRSLALL